jgi:hypothetical protein
MTVMYARGDWAVTRYRSAIGTISSRSEERHLQVDNLHRFQSLHSNPLQKRLSDRSREWRAASAVRRSRSGAGFATIFCEQHPTDNSNNPGCAAMLAPEVG